MRFGRIFPPVGSKCLKCLNDSEVSDELRVYAVRECKCWTEAKILDVLKEVEDYALDSPIQLFSYGTYVRADTSSLARESRVSGCVVPFQRVGWTSQSQQREVHCFGRRPVSGEEGNLGVRPRERTRITATKTTEGTKSASVRAKARGAGGRTGQVCWDT